jgi:voltage-gated potassium channel
VQLAIRRAMIGLGALATAIVVGILGYRWFGGYTWFDAFYMTMLTLTTVGYFEVQPLGFAGRLFNSFFLLAGVGTVLICFGILTSTIFELQLNEFFQRRKAGRMIDQLRDHFIVCGFGRVGRGAADTLAASRVPFVIVDSSEERVRMATEKGMLAVQADASSDDTLRSVGIQHARGLIAALARDPDNLFLTISARTLNSSLNIAARAIEDEAAAKLLRAGASSVFAPYRFAGARLANSLVRPHVTQLLDVSSERGKEQLEFEQIALPTECELAGRSLQELGEWRKDHRITVLAIRRRAGEMEVSPSADTRLAGGDTLVVMGPSDSLRLLEAQLAAKQP